MKTPALALLWELGWKNRVVFPLLLVLFVLGAGLAHALAHASPNAWWLGYANGSLISALLASLLLGFAPFTLMESHHGWRMNTMTTRWFVLPVRTSVLVFGPLVAGCLFIALLMGAWSLVLGPLAPGFDGRYFLLVLVFGVTGIQALGWMLARKPSWFWPVAGVFLLFVLLLGIVPQDHPHWRGQGSGMFWIVAGIIPVFAATALLAARWNRCGAWSGGLGLGWMGPSLWRVRSDFSNLRSPVAALWRADIAGLVRGFTVTWLAVALLMIGFQWLKISQMRPELAFRYQWLVLIALEILPFLGILWLAMAGLFTGCEPGNGFKTRLTGFRATAPVTAGSFAAQRIVTALLIWLVVWIPLIIACFWYDPELKGRVNSQAVWQMVGAMTKFMAVGAFVLIGALPVFLSGRFEGFPNLLLLSMVSWVGPWLLLTSLTFEEQGVVHLRWSVAIGWLLAKIGLGVWALVSSWRAGHITWRFPVLLAAGWLLLTMLLVSVRLPRNSELLIHAVGIVLLMPFARLALCPLAVSKNRHR